MDNEYLNGYARYIGPVGTAIYVALCRHAHLKDQVCYPSQCGISQELGISTRTVIRYIKKFEKYNLVKVERYKDPKSKKQMTNVYILLDKSIWKRPGDTKSRGVSDKNSKKPGDTESQ